MGTKVEPDVGSFIAVLASAYANDNQVREIAAGILPQRAAAWTTGASVHAASLIASFVKSRFRFVPDRGETLLSLEDVRNPSRWSGDCDDAVLILTSLMASINILVEVLIVGNDAGPYHAVTRAYGTIYDPTGVCTPFTMLFRKFRIWGVYPVEEG
jgi:hypothetical protein